jgi:hypothetical protein
MPQNRTGEYGTLFNHVSIRQTLRTIVAHRPRVIAGLVPMIENIIPVPTDRFIITAGFAVTGGGILVEFQESEGVVFGTPALAAQRTIVLRHSVGIVAGGEGATVELEAGMLKESVNGTILGWIDYPGGNIPLTDAHLIPTTPVLETPLNAEYLDEAYPHVEQNAPHVLIFDDPSNDVALVRSTELHNVGGLGFSYQVTSVENTDPLLAKTWTGWMVVRTKSVCGITSPYFTLRTNFRSNSAGGMTVHMFVNGADAALVPGGQAAGVWTTETRTIPPEYRPDAGEVLMLRFRVVLSATHKFYLDQVLLTARSLPYSP